MPEAQSVDTIIAIADSIEVAQSDYLPWASVEGELDGPLTAQEACQIQRGVVPYTRGIEGEPRKQLPGYDNGVLCLLILLFIVIASNFRHYSTFLKTFAQHLWSIRRRQNAFDNHTVNETRLLMSLIMLLCLCEGILIYSACTLSSPISEIFPSIVAATLLCGGYYLWQLMAYKMIGYVFSTPTDTRLWVKGFIASQILLALCLTIPALLVLFNPNLTTPLLITSVLIYFATRLIFIIKGFRIFYTNSFSLIYIILYLCNVEIVPLFILCSICGQLMTSY